jgi:hypothetical protein
MALTKTDTLKIERMVRKEMKDFMSSSRIKNLVIKSVEEELSKKGVVDKKQVVDISTKALVELFRQLWMRRSFWEQPVKNIRP